MSSRIPTTTLLEKRNLATLSDDTTTAIYTITLDPEQPTKIVGSFSHRIIEYPSDIDAFEVVERVGTKEQVGKELVPLFQEMIRRIEEHPHYYVGDFKAGEDTRYKLPLGEVKRGALVGYDPKRIRAKIRSIVKKGLLEESQGDELLSKVQDQPTLEQYTDLKESTRKYVVLRWTPEEILAGYKQLPFGQKKYLYRALGEKTIVKIDLWAPIDGKYTEVSNWYKLFAIDPKTGKKTEMSVSIFDYEDLLANEMVKYLDASLEKRLKLAKRLWSWAVFRQDSALLRDLYPLFNSPVAKLNTVVGEIETLQGMIEKLRSYPKGDVVEQVKGFKTRLSTIPTSILSNDQLLELVDIIDEINVDVPKKALIQKLDAIKKVAKKAVDAYALKYLKKKGLLEVIYKIVEDHIKK